MIKTTIREALNRTIGDVGDHMLYMVRDGDTVFYIGHSYDPLSRLETHMASSTLGTVIKANMPRSYDWQYELLTFADCARYLPMTSRYATENLCCYDNGNRRMVEIELIGHYRPCLNVINNPHPTPFPSMYRRRLPMTEIQEGWVSFSVVDAMRAGYRAGYEETTPSRSYDASPVSVVDQMVKDGRLKGTTQDYDEPFSVVDMMRGRRRRKISNSDDGPFSWKIRK